MIADASPPRLHGLARFVHSLGHPSRLIILQLLSQAGALSYREIETMTGLSNPTVRQHLKILRRVGVVERGRVPPSATTAPCGRRPHTHVLGAAVVGLHREIDYFLWELRDPNVRWPEESQRSHASRSAG